MWPAPKGFIKDHASFISHSHSVSYIHSTRVLWKSVWIVVNHWIGYKWFFQKWWFIKELKKSPLSLWMNHWIIHSNNFFKTTESRELTLHFSFPWLPFIHMQRTCLYKFCCIPKFGECWPANLHHMKLYDQQKTDTSCCDLLAELKDRKL